MTSTKSSPFIIAEMSANHCGDKTIALEIIDAAKEAGADAVKIQTYTADTITLNSNSPLFATQSGGLWAGQSLYELYKKAFTPWEWQRELKNYADKKGIELFSTPFDYTAVDFLEQIGVPRYKIASFEAFDYPLISYAAKFKKPMIISTGVSNLSEIYGAIDACKMAGNDDITILKCTSSYPADLSAMNLATISDMISRLSPLGVKVGLSDHSMSLEVPVAATALGVSVIEKHFTLDRALGGEDAGFSLNFKEFSDMVKAVRNTTRALGAVNYEPDPKNRKYARSLFVAKDIKKGEIFTPQNLRSVRPNDGLAPGFYPQILGLRAARDLKFATPLKESDIEGFEA